MHHDALMSFMSSYATSISSSLPLPFPSSLQERDVVFSSSRGGAWSPEGTRDLTHIHIAHLFIFFCFSPLYFLTCVLPVHIPGITFARVFAHSFPHSMPSPSSSSPSSPFSVRCLMVGCYVEPSIIGPICFLPSSLWS